MINRRKFLKTSLSSLALLSLPKISLAQNNYDVVVIGAGASGLAATSNLMASGKSVLCIEAMSFANDHLNKNGSFISKLFMGSSFNEIVALGKKSFKEVDIFKPPSSRKVSKENFIICRNLR